MTEPTIDERIAAVTEAVEDWARVWTTEVSEDDQHESDCNTFNVLQLHWPAIVAEIERLRRNYETAYRALYQINLAFIKTPEPEDETDEEAREVRMEMVQIAQRALLCLRHVQEPEEATDAK